MSLHMGNLSSRTRRDELERVFQRFGQCDVRLKDGYGFVVYDSPPNAGKALRALQGRNICGQPLTLTWSNRQPRFFKRFTKAARPYEPLYGSFSRGGRDYSSRKLHSNALQDYRLGLERPARNDRRLNSAEMLDEDRSYHQDSIKDYIREGHCDYREDMLDEGGNVEPNMLDNDRWCEQFNDQKNDNNIENGMDLDRYERYQGYDRKGVDENHHMAYSVVSPAPRSSQEKMVREHLSEAPLGPPNDSKLLQTCYNCGGSGHKMHNCTRRNASQRNLMRVGGRHGDDIDRSGGGECNLDIYGSGSHGKLQSNKDSKSMSQLQGDRKAYSSGRHRKLMRNGSSAEAEGAEKVHRKDHGGKRRSRRDCRILKKNSEKKAKRSVSFPIHSDCTESRSHAPSRSSKPVSRSGLHSGKSSVSSRARSSSPDSKSRSTSHYSGSGHLKSKSRSSSHTSLSLSESLGPPIPTSPNKVRLDLKGPLDNAAILESKEILVARGPLVIDARLESSKLENDMLAVKSEDGVSSYKVEDEMDKDRPMQRNEANNHIAPKSLCEITNPSTSLSEKVMLTNGSLNLETSKETKEYQNSDSSLMVQMPLPIKHPQSEAPFSSQSGHSMSISSEEMYLVLKHYGLELPDENERHLPIEDYFGSARLWPWEIIYYRRWKKGPISTKN